MTMPTPRPAGVTVVVVLTWVAAILAIVAGVTLLLASDSLLAEADITGSTATTYGWLEIAWGVVAAFVAVGLGNGNNFSRLLTTVLMALRLAGSVFAAIALSGHNGFWSAVVAGVIAVVVLALLWNNKANMFFATN